MDPELGTPVLNGMRMYSWQKLGAWILLATLTGCTTWGPKTVPGDAFNYSAAIAKSRNDQMLLNIGRVRYTQVPNFLTVSSVIAGYTYQGGIGASGQTSSVDLMRALLVAAPI